jgi:hypothetical protein
LLKLSLRNFEGVAPSLRTISTPLVPVTEEGTLLGQISFVDIDEHFYHWQTKVELRQIFKPKEVPGVSLSSLLFYSERLRKLVVSVKWKAKISLSPEFEFTEETVEGMDFVDEQFEAPDGGARIQLRHPWILQARGIEDIVGEGSAE